MRKEITANLLPTIIGQILKVVSDEDSLFAHLNFFGIDFLVVKKDPVRMTPCDGSMQVSS